MAGELRQRANNKQQNKNGENMAPEEHKVSIRRGPRIKMEWDSLFWILASFALLYFLNFASNILFNSDVKREWLIVSIVLIGVSIGCLVYSVWTHPKLSATNWKTEAPKLIAVATITILCGSISLCVAVWPVWGYWVLLIMPTLSMGFISTISLFNL